MEKNNFGTLLKFSNLGKFFKDDPQGNLFRAVKTSSDKTKRSNRPPESGTHPVGGTAIKYAALDELAPDTVFYVADGRLQIAKGTQVRPLLDCESSFNSGAAILQAVPATADPNVGGKNRKRTKATAKKKQKRRASRGWVCIFAFVRRNRRHSTEAHDSFTERLHGMAPATTVRTRRSNCDEGAWATMVLAHILSTAAGDSA